MEDGNQWLCCIFISAYVFLLIYLTVKVMHMMHSGTRRYNRITFMPFYLVIICYVFAVILLAIDAAYPTYQTLAENVDTVYRFVTCSFMGLVLLTMTVYWDLLGALLLFQHDSGPQQALVNRDEHFKHEWRIVKKYFIFAFLITLQKASEMGLTLGASDETAYIFVVIGITISFLLLCLISVSYYRLRFKLKTYYADAYHDHKWRLILEAIFCILGVICSNVSAMYSLYMQRVYGEIGFLGFPTNIFDFFGRVLPTVGICMIARVEDLFNTLNMYPEQV